MTPVPSDWRWGEAAWNKALGDARASAINKVMFGAPPPSDGGVFGRDAVVRGMAELSQKLQGFAPLLQRKAMTKVVRAGGQIVVKAARGKVSRISGRLARSIRTTVVRRHGGMQVVARVIAGRRVRKDDPYYALFVERGTKAHEIRPKGKKSLFLAGLMREQVKHPGAKAKPFLQPALEENAEAILAAMQEELAAQIEALGGSAL